MNKPIRIQLKRTKGYRMQDQSPDGREVVKVARPSLYGNPYTIAGALEAGYKHKDCQTMVVYAFKEWLAGSRDYANYQPAREKLLANVSKLRGKHLACFCPLDKPCHADVLLELANPQKENKHGR